MKKVLASPLTGRKSLSAPVLARKGYSDEHEGVFPGVNDPKTGDGAAAMRRQVRNPQAVANEIAQQVAGEPVGNPIYNVSTPEEVSSQVVEPYPHAANVSRTQGGVDNRPNHLLSQAEKEEKGFQPRPNQDGVVIDAERNIINAMNDPKSPAGEWAMRETLTPEGREFQRRTGIVAEPTEGSPSQNPPQPYPHSANVDRTGGKTLSYLDVTAGGALVKPPKQGKAIPRLPSVGVPVRIRSENSVRDGHEGTVSGVEGVGTYGPLVGVALPDGGGVSQHPEELLDASGEAYGRRKNLFVIKAISRGTELDYHGYGHTQHSSPGQRMTATEDTPDEEWLATSGVVMVDDESIGGEQTGEAYYFTEKGKAPGVKAISRGTELDYHLPADNVWGAPAATGHSGNAQSVPDGRQFRHVRVADEDINDEDWNDPNGYVSLRATEEVLEPIRDGDGKVVGRETTTPHGGSFQEDGLARDFTEKGKAPGVKLFVMKAIDEYGVSHPAIGDHVEWEGEPMYQGVVESFDQGEYSSEGKVQATVTRPNGVDIFSTTADNLTDPKTGKRRYGSEGNRARRDGQQPVSEGGKSLPNSGTKEQPNVRFSGTKKDTRGRTICYQEGNRVNCPRDQKEQDEESGRAPAPERGPGDDQNQARTQRDAAEQDQIDTDREVRHSMREMKYSFQEILDALTELKQYPYQVGEEHIDNLTQLVSNLAPEEVDQYAQAAGIGGEGLAQAQEIAQQILAAMGAEPPGMAPQRQQGPSPDSGRLFAAQGFFMLEPVPEDDPRFQAFMGANYGERDTDSAGVPPEGGTARPNEIPASDAGSEDDVPVRGR